MRQTRLQKLRRLWVSTKDYDVHRKYLTELVRIGVQTGYLLNALETNKLTQRRLKLAAFLGDEAADMVVGDVFEPRPRWRWVTDFREEELDQGRALKSIGVGLLETLLSKQAKPDIGTLVGAAAKGARDYLAPQIGPWLRQFDDWDEQGGGRAAIAATRQAIAHAEEARLREGPLRTVLRALDDWAVCPCQDHKRTVDDTVASSEAWKPGHRFTRFACEAAIRTSVAVKSFTIDAAVAAIEEATKGLGAEETAYAIGDEVIPWALGRGDPVRELVDARRGSGR